MARSSMLTVDTYLDSLSPERMTFVDAIRATIVENMDPKFEEGIQ